MHGFKKIQTMYRRNDMSGNITLVRQLRKHFFCRIHVEDSACHYTELVLLHGSSVREVPVYSTSLHENNKL